MERETTRLLFKRSVRSENIGTKCGILNEANELLKPDTIPDK